MSPPDSLRTAHRPSSVRRVPRACLAANPWRPIWSLGTCLLTSLGVVACAGERFGHSGGDAGVEASSAPTQTQQAYQQPDVPMPISAVGVASDDAGTAAVDSQPASGSVSEAPPSPTVAAPGEVVAVDPTPTAVDTPDDGEPSDDSSGEPAALDESDGTSDAGSHQSTDAGVAGAGEHPDSGSSAVEPVEEAGPPPLVEPECGGLSYEGVCWYLGERGESCRDVCEERGGFDENTRDLVGTAQQGGSLEHCARLLELLGASQPAREGRRADGAGVGCHLYGSEEAWWLASPAFDANDSLPTARRVCACLE